MSLPSFQKFEFNEIIQNCYQVLYPFPVSERKLVKLLKSVAAEKRKLVRLFKSVLKVYMVAKFDIINWWDYFLPFSYWVEFLRFA